MAAFAFTGRSNLLFMLKTITFGEIQNITVPGSQNVTISISFAVVDSSLLGQPEQDSSSKHHRLIVSISDVRQHTWSFGVKDLVKVLFEYGKRHIANLIKTGSLPHENTITMPMITSATHPDECPLDPLRISDPDKAGFEVEMERPKIGFKP
jgi:hypothetical protein